MKLLKTKFMWVIATLVLSIGYFVSCTKDNQVLDVPQINSATDLVSLKTNTPPTIDGIVDADWSKATKLELLPTVPDPGNGLFAGYSGQQYVASIRSMYDAQNIYFLVEIQDPTKSTKVAPWYFNPQANVADKTGWTKEPSSDSYVTNLLFKLPHFYPLS